MTLSASASNFDSTKVMWNAGKVWKGLAVPAAGAAPVLFTDGSPEATANPSAKHIGMTDKGTKSLYTFTKQDATSDEQSAPHLSRIVAEVMSIEGAWKQIIDPVLLTAMTVGATSVTQTSPAGTSLQLGGKQSIATDCIAVIAPQVGDPTKFVVFMIYQGYNESGFELDMTRGGESNSPFKFVAQAIPSRAVGDQLGQVFIQS